MNSQARLDYIRLYISNDHDLAQQAAGYMRKVIAEAKAVYQCDGDYSVRPQYNNATKLREYYLDIWGSLAQAVVMHAPDYVAAFGLRRADVRMSLEGATERGVQNIARALAGRRKGRRNLNVFNSAPRSKEGGRHAGGVGIAIGSHKSNWRGSIYKRGSEPAAMEGQYQGQALQALCGKLLGFADTVDGRRQEYLDFIDELAHDTEMKMMDHLDVEPFELAGVLRGERSPLILADDGDRYEQCALLFDTLAPSQKRQLISDWQDKLAA